MFDGIVHSDWTDYGIFQKVAEISGTGFNNFSNWAKSDNGTGVYYETWTVLSDNSTNPILYFDSFDCANWVLR